LHLEKISMIQKNNAAELRIILESNKEQILHSDYKAKLINKNQIDARFKKVHKNDRLICNMALFKGSN